MSTKNHVRPQRAGLPLLLTMACVLTGAAAPRGQAAEVGWSACTSRPCIAKLANLKVDVVERKHGTMIFHESGEITEKGPSYTTGLWHTATYHQKAGGVFQIRYGTWTDISFKRDKTGQWQSTVWIETSMPSTSWHRWQRSSPGTPPKRLVSRSYLQTVPLASGTPVVLNIPGQAGAAYRIVLTLHKGAA